MISIALLGLQTLAGLAPDHTAPTLTVFAPRYCAYQVAFPASVSPQEAPGTPTQSSVSAELVDGNIRFAAACLAVPASDPPAATATLPAIAAMVAALGVRDATIKPLQNLGPECGSAEGALDDTYRIEANFCLASGATFIAEAVYRNDQKNAAVSAFLESVSRKALPQ